MSFTNVSPSSPPSAHTTRTRGGKTRHGKNYRGKKKNTIQKRRNSHKNWKKGKNNNNPHNKYEEGTPEKKQRELPPPRLQKKKKRIQHPTNIPQNPCLPPPHPPSLFPPLRPHSPCLTSTSAHAPSPTRSPQFACAQRKKRVSECLPPPLLPSLLTLARARSLSLSRVRPTQTSSTHTPTTTTPTHQEVCIHLSPQVEADTGGAPFCTREGLEESGWQKGGAVPKSAPSLCLSLSFFQPSPPLFYILDLCCFFVLCGSLLKAG